MSPRRVSDIGRRLLNGAGEDEKMMPFAEKRGYTWGVGLRTGPKDWDRCQVALWPKCAYEPLKASTARQPQSCRNSARLSKTLFN